MSQLALPPPYPLTVPECLRRDLTFYAPFLPDTGSRPHRLGSIASSSAEAVDAVGTYVSAKDGLVHPALANVLRIERKGALLEGARTNLLKYSSGLNAGVWAKTRCSIAANDRADPAGGTEADKIIPSTDASTSHYLRSPSMSFTSGTQYVYSTYLRAAEYSWFQLRFTGGVSRFPANVYCYFDLTNGVKGTVGAGLDASGIEDAGGGWYRCWIVATANSTGTSNPFENVAEADGDTSFTGNGSDGIHWWGGQIEVGGFPSTHIPTFGSSVVRAADDLRYDNTNEVHCKAAQGTVIVAVTPEFASADHNTPAYILSLLTASGNDGIALYHPSTANKFRWLVVSGGANVAVMSSSTAAVRGTTVVLTGTWELDGFRLYVDGTEEGSDTAGAAPSAQNATMHIGQNESNAQPFFGNIAHLMIFKRALNPPEVKGVSDIIANWT